METTSLLIQYPANGSGSRSVIELDPMGDGKISGTGVEISTQGTILNDLNSDYHIPLGELEVNALADGRPAVYANGDAVITSTLTVQTVVVSSGLTVNAPLIVADGNQGEGKIFVSSANGLGVWTSTSTAGIGIPNRHYCHVNVTDGTTPVNQILSSCTWYPSALPAGRIPIVEAYVANESYTVRSGFADAPMYSQGTGTPFAAGATNPIAGLYLNMAQSDALQFQSTSYASSIDFLIVATTY